jgi:mono/diheme cytochrome c family protein
VKTGKRKVWLWLCGATLCFCSCKREQRMTHVDPAAAILLQTNSISGLQPGPSWNEITTNYAWTNLLVAGVAGAAITTNVASDGSLIGSYHRNAWSMSEGKRLFVWFNCNGCHGNGGGGMGPALMDNKWIYGHQPQDIFTSIMQGRTNGMPAFKDRVPEYVGWQLTAYVRSISGLAPFHAAPSRNDHLQTKPAEHTIDTPPPEESQ